MFDKNKISMELITDNALVYKTHDVVSTKLDFWNTSNHCKDYVPFCIRVFNVETGNFLGGISCYVFCCTLIISFLFVDESINKKGFGKQLVDMAEKHSQSLGAKAASVWTMNFQAPGFYEKNGYRELSSFNLGDGSSMHMLFKDFESR